MLQGHTGTALGIIADNSVLEGAVNFTSRASGRLMVTPRRWDLNPDDALMRSASGKKSA